MSIAIINVCVQSLVWRHALNYLGYITRNEIARSHITILCLIFWRQAKVFSKLAIHSTSLPAMHEESNLYISLATLVIILNFYYSHSSGHEETPHCCFWFAFPYWVMLCILSCTYWSFVYHHWINDYSYSWPILLGYYYFIIYYWVVIVIYIF